MSLDFSGAPAHPLQIGIHGPACAPTIIYLPGLHGDGTLIGPFREALIHRVRFVEVAYPNTVTWSLAEHAIAIEMALHNKGIHRVWLLGESFGSQLVWALLARGQLEIEGVILAGGFVRHPACWAASFSAWCGDRIPFVMVKTLLLGYAAVAPWRFRTHPDTARRIKHYVDTFTENRRKALTYRLRLVAANNPRETARRIEAPVFAISGFWDPVVPWSAVRTWLKRNCLVLREYRVLWSADHNVLGTASEAASKLVLRWLGTGLS